MRNSLSKTLLAVAVILIGFAAIFGIGSYLEKSRPALYEGYEDEDLALQGARLKGYSFGAEGLIADWYWMNSLQYVGDKILKNPNATIRVDDLRDLNPRLLYPYLDNATTLDPKFLAAYSYGAVVLPTIDKDQAIKLVQKGIENNPDNWVLYQYLGYIYWRSKDYENAAMTYEKGASIKGAAPFMRLMAANMKSGGGSRSTARAIYTEIYNQADDPQIKIAAKSRLMSVTAQDEQDAIRAALKMFQQKNNRCAQNWTEILPILSTVKLPDNIQIRLNSANSVVDPSGMPYLLDKEKCDVKIDFAKSEIVPFGD